MMIEVNGSKNHVVTESQKSKISATLKQYYKQNGFYSTCTKIHVYNYDGSFLKSYPSIKLASEDLNLSYKMLTKSICGYRKFPKYVKYQFSYIFVDAMKNNTIISSRGK